MRFILAFSLVALFLLLNACQQEQTKFTENGHEYILHLSNGGNKPNPGDYVYFHAQMRNGDSILYTSRAQGSTPRLQIPTTPNPARKPSVVEDVLKELGLGDSATVSVRIDTMTRKPRGFENADEMFYDVVVTQIQTKDEYLAEIDKQREEARIKREEAKAREEEVAAKITDIAKKYADGALDAEIKTTDSGLKYLVHEQGEGKKAVPGRMINVHYYGILPDGTMFDNSFNRGNALNFPLGAGQVIKGWDEGLALLNEGGKATLFIPAHLGYGEAGSPPKIPGGSELIFYVELEKVN